jgi:hypothetical protein
MIFGLTSSTCTNFCQLLLVAMFILMVLVKTIMWQVNVVTQRGFVPVDERMQVLDAEGNKVSRFMFSYILKLFQTPQGEKQDKSCVMSLSHDM